MLGLIGVQLREAIAAGRVDADLIAAAEWALDRHRARAIRLIANGLGDHAELVESLHSHLAEELHAEVPPDGPHAERLHRLLNLLRVMVGDAERREIEKLDRRLEAARADAMRAAATPEPAESVSTNGNGRHA